MKIIIQATAKKPERLKNSNLLCGLLDGSSIYINDDVNNFQGFIEILKSSSEDDLLFIEDDALLCERFKELAYPFIEENKEKVIQFMDLKKSDFSTKEMPASSFCMSVCVYIPKKVINTILMEYENFLIDNPKDQTAHDYLIGYALKKRKEKYIIHRPCLAQHLSFDSVVHPGASRGRQSKFFIDL